MKSTGKVPSPIVCFGEALWDILPRGIFLGGAPLNVAYHLSRLGVRAIPISAVGRDFFGNEALRRIAQWNITTEFIARHLRRPTGTVRVELSELGIAHYEIVGHVAWDWIKAPRSLRRYSEPAALVYGSLALREKNNRTVLMDLFAKWPKALRVLDLNLRAPFDQGGGVKFALSYAQVVKLNDEELSRMTGKPVASRTQLRAAAHNFVEQHGAAQVCVTAGARGAGLLWARQWYWEVGRPVAVRDTVGAGDAFLAAFLAAHLRRGESPGEALKSACRLGEFVAGRDGATPPYQCDSRGEPGEIRRLRIVRKKSSKNSVHSKEIRQMRNR